MAIFVECIFVCCLHAQERDLLTELAHANASNCLNLSALPTDLCVPQVGFSTLVLLLLIVRSFIVV